MEFSFELVLDPIAICHLILAHHQLKCLLTMVYQPFYWAQILANDFLILLDLIPNYHLQHLPLTLLLVRLMSFKVSSPYQNLQDVDQFD